MLGTELKDLALQKVRELAPSASELAICEYGPSVYAKPGSYRGEDVLVVCDGYAEGLRAHRHLTNRKEVRFLVADRNLIESDVKEGTLGDFLTEILLYPTQPIANDEYLERLGVEARARVIKEEIRDLVVEYGEMCRGLVAKPEFFALSKLRERARVFLASMDEYRRLLEAPVRERNLFFLRESFKVALQTVRGNLVEFDGHDATITDSAVDRWLKNKASEQVVNILRHSQRAFYSYLAKGRAVYLNLDLIARELYTPLQFGLGTEFAGVEPEDPKNFLYLRTSEGLASLNERASLEDIILRLRPERPLTISPLAGVLNEVFLVTIGKKRFVAKKFTDWHGFKWFTLNLVSFGSKFFAVSGKARMTSEYGMNRYLAKKGLKVPQILHVSVKQRLLLENYISGIPLDEFVADGVRKGILTKSEYELAQALGETLARIHEVGVSVGDSKPENFVAADGEIYTVDLEQAGRKGDYAWDIAELLFYAGHYSETPVPSRGLTQIVEAFIHGYLRRGDRTELRRAAGVRYAKVFSIWTPALIILEISKMLREAS